MKKGIILTVLVVLLAYSVAGVWDDGKDTNTTYGFAYLTNNSFQDTAEFYNYSFLYNVNLENPLYDLTFSGDLNYFFPGALGLPYQSTNDYTMFAAVNSTQIYATWVAGTYTGIGIKPINNLNTEGYDKLSFYFMSNDTVGDLGTTNECDPINNKGIRTKLTYLESLPVAYYPLNHNASDYTRNSNGTVIGATQTAGQIDGAYSFDGVNDYINLSYTTNGLYTVCLWLKPTHKNHNWILDARSAAPGDTGYIYGDQSGVMGVSSGNRYINGAAGFNTINNTFNHFCVVDINLISTRLLIGEDLTINPTKAFNGSIDDVAIWDRALNQTEILAIYNNGLNGYPLNSKTLNTSHDCSILEDYKNLKYDINLTDNGLNNVSIYDLSIFHDTAASNVEYTLNVGDIFLWDDFLYYPDRYTGDIEATFYTSIANNGFGFNTEVLRGYERANKYENLIVTNFTGAANYETLAKVIQYEGYGTIQTIGFNLQSQTRNAIYLDTGIIKYRDDVGAEINTGHTPGFNKWVWFKGIINNTNLSYYYANISTPTTWHLIYSVNTSLAVQNPNFVVRHTRGAFDNIIVRELQPQYIPYNKYHVSFIYDSSNNTEWTQYRLREYNSYGATSKAVFNDYTPTDAEIPTYINTFIEPGIFKMSARVYSDVNTASVFTQNLYYNLSELNITFKDETTDTIITDRNITVSFNGVNDWFNDTNKTDTGLISYPFIGFDDYLITAAASGYSQRYYDFDNWEFGTEAITIYLLNESLTDFSIVRLIDENKYPIIGARVDIYKDFAGTFVLINSLESNFEGETTADFVRETVYYQFKVYINNILVYTTQDTLIFKDIVTIQIPINGNELLSLEYYNEAVGNVYLVNNSGVMRYHFDYSGANIKAAKLTLNEQVLNADSNLLATNESTAQFGTLSLSFIPSPGVTYIAKGWIDTNTSGSWFVVDQDDFNLEDNFAVFGYLGLLLSIFFIGTLAAMKMDHPSGAIILALVALVVVSLVGFVNIGYGVLITLIAVGGLIIFINKT